MLKNKNIVLGITGSIAAYKMNDVIRVLQKEHASLECVLTKAGEQFVTTVTLEALMQKRVYTDLFGDYTEKRAIHIRLAEWADCVVVAPASADFIAKVSCGIADDLLTSLILATRVPLLFAPAMHEHMWNNGITQENVHKLFSRGITFIGPESGMLSDGTQGVGHIARTEDIVEAIKNVVASSV